MGIDLTGIIQTTRIMNIESTIRLNERYPNKLTSQEYIGVMTDEQTITYNQHQQHNEETMSR